MRVYLGIWPLRRASLLFRSDLFGLLGPLTLAEADTRAAAVLVDELDAGREHVSYRFFLGALAV
jgi:hypothetical protein